MFCPVTIAIMFTDYYYYTGLAGWYDEIEGICDFIKTV